MGAATALYSATCFAQGKYGNGSPYPVNLRVVVGLSGWLPCARWVSTLLLLNHINFKISDQMYKQSALTIITYHTLTFKN